MGLKRGPKETLEFAGKLMNIGKIFTPEDLLAKDGALSPEEIEKVRESVALSADLIQNIPFDGPVAETIRQSQEQPDGLGPLGLKGDAIIITAKILAVANAFVSMASGRPYRPGLDMDSALEILMRESGGKYDRAVVAALMNYLENRSHDNAWLTGPQA
jgi:HD-GYP domain-containing protein (c-di-GMP phosphodiesterase class II)